MANPNIGKPTETFKAKDRSEFYGSYMLIQLILQTIFRASAGLGDIGELKAWHILNIANISGY